MQRVFVLDSQKNPLMPCTPSRVMILLTKKQASVFKYVPFTIILHCKTCNQDKGNDLPNEWLQRLSQSTSNINTTRFNNFSKIVKGIKPSMSDAALMNVIRFKVVENLKQFHLPIELGSSSLTKYNATKQNLPKDHWIDAACMGNSGANVIIQSHLIPLHIKAIGRGSRQMCRVDQYCFPRTKAKLKGSFYGFKTGDLVKAIVFEGKKKGTCQGRIAVRDNGYFNITTKHGVIQGISHKVCRLLQRNDGYQYSNHNDLTTIGKK